MNEENVADMMFEAVEEQEVERLRSADTAALDALLQREGAERFFAFRDTGDAAWCLRWAEDCLAAGLGDEVEDALLELASWMGKGSAEIIFSEFECGMQELCRKLGVELPADDAARDLVWLYDLHHKQDSDFHVNIWQMFGDARFADLERIYREWERHPGAHESALTAELERLRRCLTVMAVGGEIRLMFAA